MSDARRIGSKFETDTVSYLRGTGAAAERLARAGSLDEGDVVVTSAGRLYIFELKARRDPKTSLNLGSWLEEAHREAGFYRKARHLADDPQPLLIVKHPGKSIGKAFVIQYLEDWINEHTG